VDPNHGTADGISYNRYVGSVIRDIYCILLQTDLWQTPLTLNQSSVDSWTTIDITETYEYSPTRGPLQFKLVTPIDTSTGKSDSYELQFCKLCIPCIQAAGCIGVRFENNDSTSKVEETATSISFKTHDVISGLTIAFNPPGVIPFLLINFSDSNYRLMTSYTCSVTSSIVLPDTSSDILVTVTMTTASIVLELNKVVVADIVYADQVCFYPTKYSLLLRKVIITCLYCWFELHFQHNNSNFQQPDDCIVAFGSLEITEIGIKSSTNQGADQLRIKGKK